MSRLRNLFNRSPRPARPPQVTIAQRVIDKIVANALHYATETGESLVGLVIPSQERQEPDLYVLDTIAPDESAIREGAYFEQGDDLQGDTFNWLYDNWELLRRQQGGLSGTPASGRWNVPLMHLGDWHKHPGTYFQPSLGDLDTAREQLFERGSTTTLVLVMLATVWDNGTAAASAAAESPPADAGSVDAEAEDSLDEQAILAGLDILDELDDPDELEVVVEPSDETAITPLRVPIDAHTVVRIDCWYMSRNIRRFVHLAPTVIPDADLPALPPIGWHLRAPTRMRAEVDALTREGYAVSIEQLDADNRPPLEICLSLARRDSQHILIVVTMFDYPETIPAVRVVPMSAMQHIQEHEHFFDRLWKASQPLAADAYPDWVWTSEHHIIDLVRAIEPRITEGSEK